MGADARPGGDFLLEGKGREGAPYSTGRGGLLRHMRYDSVFNFLGDDRGFVECCF